MIVLVIFVVVVIIFVISKATQSGTPSDKDNRAINEAINYIESVKQVFSDDSILKQGETLGCFQIIPIDDSKEMYARSSCRVMFMLLLYETDSWHIQVVDSAAARNSSVFSACFHIETINDDKHYVAYSVCSFTSDYKGFMKHLYAEVNTRYPGKFQFDGSRIMSVAEYGTSIF